MGLQPNGLKQSLQEGALEFEPEDLTQRSPSAGEVSIHDGSGIYSESLCFAVAGSWYNVIDGSTM